MANGKNGEAEPAANGEDRKPTMKNWLMKAQPSIAGVIPAPLRKYVTPERVVRVALMSIDKDPNLKLCTPKSILGAVMEASKLGLEIGGVAGHAYLVPFKNRVKDADGNWHSQWLAQFIPGYRGLVQLVYRAGGIDIDADVVYEADKFDWQRGTQPFLSHKPSLDADRGPLVGAWALARFPDGRSRFEIMSVAQIDRIRETSATGQSPKSPWTNHYDEMAKKSVAKRLIKWLPLTNDDLAKAVNYDNQAERGEVIEYEDVIDIEPGPPPSNIKNAGIDAIRQRGEREMSDEEKAEIEREESNR